MIQRASEWSPPALAQGSGLAGRWRDAAARRLSQQPTPERPQLRGEWTPGAPAAVQPRGPSGSLRLTVATRRQAAARRGEGHAESEREGPATNRRPYVNKIAARRAGGPTGSSRRTLEQEVPRAPLRSPHVPRPARIRDTVMAPGVGSPPSTPPTFPPRGEGRGNPDLNPVEAPPPAVPDISLGLASRGRRGDDTRPATFALLGSRRSGSWLLAGAARCRLQIIPRQRRRRRPRRAQRSCPLVPPSCSAFRLRPPMAQPPPWGPGALTSSPPHQPSGKAEREGQWVGLRHGCGRGIMAELSPALVRRGLGSRTSWG